MEQTTEYPRSLFNNLGNKEAVLFPMVILLIVLWLIAVIIKFTLSGLIHILPLVATVIAFVPVFNRIKSKRPE